MLDVRGRDVIRIGVALDPRLTGADALWGRMAALCLWAFAVQVHELRIAHIGTERAFNCFKICSQPIRC
jgi:hypothetical protein